MTQSSCITVPPDGLEVIVDEDGVWLSFSTCDGLHALLHVEMTAQHLGGLVGKALSAWAAERLKTQEAGLPA